MRIGGLRTKGIYKSLDVDRPLVSIVTVVFNGQETLEVTIKSVVAQSYPNIEYIVCDGCSADKTIDILSAHQNSIDYWVSESDLGIYDAMNKGIALCRGEWVIFMGSDDYFVNNDSVEKLVRKATPNVSVVFGDVVYDDGRYFKSKMSLAVLMSNTLHHQAALYSKALFQDFQYDISCKVCSDYELNLIIFIKKLPFCYVNELISFCRSGGATTAYKEIANHEVSYIRRKHFPLIVSSFLALVALLWVMLSEWKKKVSDLLGHGNLA